MQEWPILFDSAPFVYSIARAAPTNYSPQFFSTKESYKAIKINAANQWKHAKSNGFGKIWIPVIVWENRSSEYWVPIKVRAHIIEVFDCMMKRLMPMNSVYLTTPKYKLSIEYLKL